MGGFTNSNRHRMHNLICNRSVKRENWYVAAFQDECKLSLIDGPFDTASAAAGKVKNPADQCVMFTRLFPADEVGTNENQNEPTGKDTTSKV